MSNRITKWCQENGEVDVDQYPIVAYGIELLLNTSTKVLGICVIAILLGCFKEVVVVMIAFGTLRQFTGGYHCRTHVGCFVSMLSICLGATWMVQWKSEISTVLMIAVVIWSLYMIIRYAPRNSKVNPIRDECILRWKRIGSLSMSAVYGISVWALGWSGVCWLIVIPLFGVAILVSPMLYKYLEGYSVLD